MKVLFLCKANIFRSIVAEFTFKKYSKKNEAMSAAIEDRPYHGRTMREIYHNNEYARKFISSQGFEIDDYTSKKVTEQMTADADKIVILLENENSIPVNLKYNSKVIFWKVEDGIDANKKLKPEEDLKRIIVQIKELVKNFVKEIE